MNKKRISRLLGISLLAVTVMSNVSPIGANAAWKQNRTGWWYTEGSSWATGWRKISGVWYYFDKSGYMKTGWVKDNGIWYYLDKSGAMKTGWVKDNGVWYYLDKSGAMKTGWVKDNGTWYYLEKSGAMKTGWVKHSGAWYYLEKSGAMKTGWVKDNSTWYYLDNSGAMKTGWVTAAPTVMYYLDKSGASASGWTEIDGKMYYFKEREQGGYVMAVDSFIDGYYVDKSGVGENIVPLTVADQSAAIELIKKNDSDYIAKRQSENSSFGLHESQGIDNTKLLFVNDGTLKDEPAYIIGYFTSEDLDFNKSGFYVVGAISGKVYCVQNNNNRVYEISDNKIVGTRSFMSSDPAFTESDWR